MIKRRQVLGTLIGLAGVRAHAADWPDRPIKVLHGFGAGGPPDTVLRLIARRLELTLGQPVIVENRPGASGTIAAAAVARAAPVGYTLLFGVAANLAVAPATMKVPPYDPVSAFAPIVEVASGPYLWLVRGDAPVHTMAEFVAWAKSAPGQLHYGSPGIASVHHLATELLERAAGMHMIQVPYTSSPYIPLLAGQIDAMFDSLPGPLPYLESGKLRALGITGSKRLRRVPAVPTLEEQGLRGIDVNSWWGFVAPAGTPGPIVQRVNAEVRNALSDPSVQELLSRFGIEQSATSPQDFAALIRADGERWRQLATTLGVSER